MAKRSKGIPADGKKIQELRKKAGKTQKGLLSSSTIELRTYQRAEKGEHILPELLEQIATLLGTQLKDIRADKATPAQVPNSYRLHNLLVVGAHKFLKELQGHHSRVNYDFAINPNSALAERVAEMIDYCRHFEITINDGSVQTLDPASAIRVVGALNDRAASLSTDGVHVYFGRYTEYDIRKDEHTLFPTEVTGGDPIVPYHAVPDFRLRIMFSNESSEFITKTFSSWLSFEEASVRSVKTNLKLGIHPDWFEPNPFGFDEDYVSAYRAAYLVANPEPKLLSLVRAKD